jgi:hypothetical protein
LRVAISPRRWCIFDNVQFANRQFVHLQFAKPRALDHDAIDGKPANGERSYCDRAKAASFSSGEPL